MSLDKLSKKNHLSHGPFIPVFQWWYNELVDFINAMFPSAGSSKTDTIGEYTSGSEITFSDPIRKTCAPALTAHAGGTKAAALQLTEDVNIITVCATLNDSVLLPTPAVGKEVVVINLGAAGCAVYANGTTTIDDIVTANPFMIYPEDCIVFRAYTTGKWQSDREGGVGYRSDLTPVTRTTGQLVATNTVHANLDLLDSAIGYDAQMSGTGKNVDKTLSVFQNLDRLDTYKSVQTVKKTIGGVGVANCDFNFVTAANQNEQVIDLGSIVPALARVLDVMIVTDSAFTGAVSLATEAGNSSSGHEFLGAADIIAAGTINSMATDHDHTVVPNVAATKVYVSSTPGANWSLVTAGKMSVYVTFINVANI